MSQKLLGVQVSLLNLLQRRLNSELNPLFAKNRFDGIFPPSLWSLTVPLTPPLGHVSFSQRRFNGMEGSPVKELNKKTPFLIGVAGGTASGKTTVCEKIMEAVVKSQESGGERNIVTLSQDSFYRELDSKESKQAQRGLFNFDHPDAFDHELMMTCLSDIRDGKMTKVPVYDFKTNSR